MSNNEFENPESPSDSQPANPANSTTPAATTPSTAAGDADHKPGWERDVLEKLALFAVKEQRARRRWSNFFKIAGLVVFIFVIWSAFNTTSFVSERSGRQMPWEK